MTMTQLRRLVEDAANHQNEVWIGVAGSDNPKAIAVGHAAESLQELFDAVLQAIDGDPVLLRTYC